MLPPSFPSLLRLGAISLVVVIVSGCGEARKDRASQLVAGNGFAFTVPAGWDVKRTPRAVSATGSELDLISASVARLVRPYRPELAQPAARELDRVAAKLAVGLGGSVASSEQLDLGPGLTRRYEIRYRDLVQEITFVLVDRREVQLTCRRKADGDRAPCKELVASFRLA